MELKRDWEMQDLLIKKNPLLIPQDLGAPKQDTALLLFQHYLITNTVVGQLRRLTAFWWWDDPTAGPSSLCLYPKLIRGGTKTSRSGFSLLLLLVQSAKEDGCNARSCLYVLSLCLCPGYGVAFAGKGCYLHLGMYSQGTWEHFFSKLCHRQAAWPWQIT